MFFQKCISHLLNRSPDHQANPVERLENQKTVEHLKTRQISLRKCILFQVKQGIGIKRAHKKLCKELGKEDFMEYTEYEYWYYRFYNGDHDVNHDRSLDPKTRKFIEMPVDAIEMIMRHLPTDERFKFRRVSRRLRDIFDMRFPGSYKIRISCYQKKTMLYLEDRKEEKHLFQEKSPVELAMADMIYMIKHPKLIIERLDFYFDLANDPGEDSEPKHCINLNFFKSLTHKRIRRKREEDSELRHSMNLIINLLNCLTHKVHVKTLYCQPELLAMFLKYMKPGALELLLLDNTTFFFKAVMSDVFELDQWKQARSLDIYGSFFWPIEHLSHCTSLTISLEIRVAEDLIPVKKILQTFSNLQYGKIKFRPFNLKANEMWKELGQLEQPPIPERPDVRHCRAASSEEELFELTFIKLTDESSFWPLGLDYLSIERKGVEVLE